MLRYPPTFNTADSLLLLSLASEDPDWKTVKHTDPVLLTARSYHNWEERFTLDPEGAVNIF